LKNTTAIVYFREVINSNTIY